MVPISLENFPCNVTCKKKDECGGFEAEYEVSTHTMFDKGKVVITFLNSHLDLYLQVHTAKLNRLITLLKTDMQTFYLVSFLCVLF